MVSLTLNRNDILLAVGMNHILLKLQKHGGLEGAGGVKIGVGVENSTRLWRRPFKSIL